MTARQPNEAEQRLWEAFPRGEWVDLRTGDPEKDDVASALDWDDDRVVRAEVIAELLLGAAPLSPGQRPAVRLRGARVQGRLDLMGAEVPYPLICEYCHFAAPIRLVEATTRTIRLVRSSLHSVNGARLAMNGILNLYRSTVSDGFRLDRARVNGDVTLRGARFAPGPDGVALVADGLVVDGDLELDKGFHANGPVLLRGTRVEGRLDLQDAVIEAPAGDLPALGLGRVTAGAGVIASRLRVRGEMWLTSAHVEGEVRLDGAVLRNPGGVALRAGGLVVEGRFLARDGFTAEGEVRLAGAQIRTFLAIAGASLSAPGGMALLLDQAAVNDVDARDLTVSGGRVCLVGARIGSDLTLAGASLDCGDGDVIAFTADKIVIGGTLDCTRLRARGEVRSVVGRISARFELRDARLEGQGGGPALRLSRAEIGADLFCGGLTASGTIKLSGARVVSRVDLRNVRLSKPGGTALESPTLEAREFTLRPAEPIEGRVVLEHARIGVLYDDPEKWPDALSMNGLTYESLEPRLPAQARLRWLALDPDGHQPQPYEQLAAHYTALGQAGEARRVLLAKERTQRGGNTPMGKVWSGVQDTLVGYGYQPWRAALWLILLVTAGSVVYGTQPPAPLKPDEAPHFNAVVYTLDLLLPLVDLGQERAFNPAGGYQWFSYALVAAGWVLVTVIAAAVARVLSRR